MQSTTPIDRKRALVPRFSSVVPRRAMSCKSAGRTPRSWPNYRQALKNHHFLDEFILNWQHNIIIPALLVALLTGCGGGTSTGGTSTGSTSTGGTSTGGTSGDGTSTGGAKPGSAAASWASVKWAAAAMSTA